MGRVKEGGVSEMVRFSFLPPEANLNRRKILIDVKEVIFYFKVFLYLHLQTESSVVGRRSCYILEKAFTNALSDTRISQIRPQSREAAVDTYVYRQLVLSHFMCVNGLPYAWASACFSFKTGKHARALVSERAKM